jgi:hypothetical protein
MQFNFSCTERTAHAVCTTISRERLRKYLALAGGDEALAIRLYAWNSAMCACFYGPIQVVEVAVRNAIANRLETRFGAAWPSDARFINLLKPYQRNELTNALQKERRQHRALTSTAHVISALTFGFWTSLLGKQMDKHLWAQGMTAAFPLAAARETRQIIATKLNEVRTFRNDVMHYRSVFDKQPRLRMQQIDETLGYLCDNTRFLVANSHGLETIISNKPS